MELDKVYEKRFRPEEWKHRDQMWNILCEHFFNQWLAPNDDILDIAAGYCDFINNAAQGSHMGRRIAVDLNPDIKKHAHDFVETYHAPAQALDFLEDASVDKVFVSNFFEHVPQKEDILKILREIARVLRPSGRLLILQPNIKYLTGEYWDFFDHYTPLTERSMCEALEIAGGYKVLKVINRFLPYTTKSKIPQALWMIRLYCHVPLAWRIMGKQMFIVAEKIK